MLGFGYPFIAVGLGSFLLHDGDRFFLLRYGGETAVGIYAFGYRIARLVSMFSREPLQAVWAAQMYDVAKTPEAPEVFGRAFSRIIGVYITVGLALCLFQDEVTALLGGPQFADAARLFGPVVLAYAFTAAAETMDSGFYVRRRTKVKFWITLSSTAVMLALYAILIPKFGIEGAAFATLFGFLFNAWLTWKVSQRVFPVKYEFARLGAMLGLGALTWGFSRLLPASLWMIPAKAVLWLMWAGTLWIFGLVSADEKQWVLDTLSTFLGRLSAYLPSRRTQNTFAVRPEVSDV
jgi:O-antigen/teichoic acid export membrane protein